MALYTTSSIGKGNGNPLQCSCLENPRDRGAWWAAVYGVAQSWTWLKRLSSSSIHNSEDRNFKICMETEDPEKPKPSWERKTELEESSSLTSDCTKLQSLGFPGGSVVKNVAANAGETGSIPGWGRSHMRWNTTTQEQQLLECALEPGSHSYWAHVLQLLKPERPKDHTPQQEKPWQWEAHAPWVENSLCLNYRKAHTAMKTQKSQK